jgi:uncharacterized protein (DUF2062 family)
MFERLRRRLPSQEALRQNRWLRWLGPTMFHPRLWHMSRRGIALGAGIGVFFAFLIPIAQIPLSVAASVMLRANVPTAVVSTLINNPVTFPPVYYAAWKVGSVMLGEEAHPDNAPTLPQVPPEAQAGPAQSKGFWRSTVEGLRAVGKPLLVGALTFAGVFGLLTYLLVNGIWHLHVRIKRRGRMRRRAA